MRWGDPEGGRQRTGRVNQELSLLASLMLEENVSEAKGMETRRLSTAILIK